MNGPLKCNFKEVFLLLAMLMAWLGKDLYSLLPRAGMPRLPGNRGEASPPEAGLHRGMPTGSPPERVFRWRRVLIS